jgi:hypothetical protein
MKTSPNQFKNTARGVSADLSSQAIAKRVRIMDLLWAEGWKMRRQAERTAVVAK